MSKIRICIISRVCLAGTVGGRSSSACLSFFCGKNLKVGHYAQTCVCVCVCVCVCICLSVIISLCSGLFLCTVMQYIGFVGVLFSA